VQIDEEVQVTQFEEHLLQVVPFK